LKKVVRYRKNTNLKAIHNYDNATQYERLVVRYRKNTNLKAIHNRAVGGAGAYTLLDTAKIQI